MATSTVFRHSKIYNNYYYASGTAQTFTKTVPLGAQVIIVITKLGAPPSMVGMWVGIAWDSASSYLVPVMTSGSGSSVSIADKTITLNLGTWTRASIIEILQ